MITRTCDRCERLIEVGDEYAGQKVECPACGDVNRMPDAASPTPRSAPHRREERRVLKVHQAMFRARPLLASLLFLLLFAGAGLTVYWALIDPRPVLAWVVGLASAVLLVILALWKIKTIDESLEITTERCILRVGLFSRRTSEVNHSAIRNVSISQSLWNRIWRVGSLSISSAGQDGFEIVIRDIADPQRVRDAIDSARDHQG